MNHKAVQQPQIRPPAIPFDPSDRILLVGEGKVSVYIFILLYFKKADISQAIFLFLELSSSIVELPP